MIPPIAPISGWDTTSQAAPAKPFPILADAIDPLTRDWADLFEGVHPVDGYVAEAFAIERDSGASVVGFGHRLRDVRHVDETTPRQLRDAAKEALRDAERARLVQLVELVAEGEETDEAALLLRYRNLIEQREKETVLGGG